LRELRRHHACSRIFGLVETIDLRFNVVAVGITVIETDRWAMIDAPIWFDAKGLSLAVGQEELGNVFEGEGDVLWIVSC
jgi:hypothetical protein